jgi:catechol 2,3-dioxygenase-like lactoylglutathione lyase family enzyme
MYDHIGLKVKDLAKSKAFYNAVLGALGHTLAYDEPDCAGFGKGVGTFWLYPAAAPTGSVHIAFSAGDAAAVQRFYDAGIAAGGRDNGPPGPRPDYGAKYHAAFLYDPDGNNVEAVVAR